MGNVAFDLSRESIRHEPEPRRATVHRGPGPDALLDRPRRQPPAGVRGAPRGRPAGGAGRLPARAVPHAVFLPGRGPGAVRPRRADPRADDRGAGRRRAGDGHGRRRLDLRAAGGRGLPQHGGRARRRRVAPRPLSQDAHPRRPALLREVLFHPRRPRVPGDRHAGRPASARSSAGTSGIPRPRG